MTVSQVLVELGYIHSLSELDGKELEVARAALRLTLNGQLPRRKRLRLRDKEIEMSAHPENAR